MDIKETDKMIKVNIISGFLGAGKTTLIKKLIQEAFKGEKLVLIENEFGEIGVDSGFLKEAGVQVQEINAGCICCSLVGNFETALQEVIDTYHPERIIIEPSGVGKLSDVKNAVLTLPKSYDIAIEYSVAVVDTRKCKMYKRNYGEFFINQVASADSVVLSRSQGVTEGKIEEAVTIIRELNETATIITTPWDKLTGEQFLNAFKKSGVTTILEDTCCHEHHHHEDGECCHEHHHHHEDGECCHEHHHHHEDGECCHEHHHHEDGECCHEHHHHDGECCHDHHHAEDVFISWGIETFRKFTADMLEDILRTFESGEYGTVLRAKGIVESEDGTWLHFNYVPEESNVVTGPADYTGRICVIGVGLKEDRLEELFS